MRFRWLVISFLVGAAIAFSNPLAQAGKIVGETDTYAREQGFRQRFFYVAAGNGAGQVEYICRAFTGRTTAVTDALWQIQQFTYDSSNRLSTILFADGDDGYDNVCNDRVSLTYS